MTTLDDLPVETLDELERLEREAEAAGAAFDADKDSYAKMHACISATQRFHDKLHENPRALIAAARELSSTRRELERVKGEVARLRAARSSVLTAEEQEQMREDVLAWDFEKGAPRSGGGAGGENG